MPTKKPILHLHKHLKQHDPKKSAITATPKSLMDEICNQGPVDTPGEIQYRYYNNGPVDTPGEQKVRYHNPGPKDTPGEIKANEKSENKNDDAPQSTPSNLKKG